MRDVATVAGVDVSVVSRVLSGDERLLIRRETRERVLEAVDRLGYRPNLAARTLSTARTMAIGMIVPDFANAAYAEIARGAEQRASELDYFLLLASGRIQDRLPMLPGRIDGLLYAIATNEPAEPTRLPKGLPSLLVNRREPRLGVSVVGNDEAAAELATQHLIDLGHRRIAHLLADHSIDTGRRRSAGYARAMSEAGLSTSPELTIETPSDEEGGRLATLELLRRDPPPTALFVATARWSLGALAACDELGVSVPDDLSIVAFSDIPIARYLHPALTTVQLPLATMGSRAVEMLMQLMDGQTVEDVTLDDPPELIVRRSTAPPPADAR